MQQFILYWYISSAPRFYQAWLSILSNLESQIAIRETLQNLDKPLFQDYTLQGRIIGVGFRLARAFFGLILYALSAIVYAFLYIVWLIFPLLCIVSLVGAFIGVHHD